MVRQDVFGRNVGKGRSEPVAHPLSPFPDAAKGCTGPIGVSPNLTKLGIPRRQMGRGSPTTPWAPSDSGFSQPIERRVGDLPASTAGSAGLGLTLSTELSLKECAGTYLAPTGFCGPWPGGQDGSSDWTIWLNNERSSSDARGCDVTSQPL